MPKTSEVKPLEANTCFGCGEDNPIGLKLNFQWDGATAWTKLVPRKEYEGWPGIIHGGIVFLLLDEAMAWVSRRMQMQSLTARADVKYHRPLRVGEEVTLSATSVKVTRKVLDAKAAISLGDGTIIAEGTCTMLRMDNMEDFIKFVEGAVIWDLDGVLVDTAAYHFSSWRDTLSKRGVSFSQEEFRQTFGMRNAEIIKKIFGDSISSEDMQAIAVEKEMAFRSQITGGLKALPGVMKLLKELKDNNYKMALATSAPMENVKAILEALGISEYFDAIISDEDVKNGKPDPEVFIKAAVRMGVKVLNCLVFEDSIAGIQAAKGAGMNCIAVSITHPAEKLSQADLVVSSLEEVDTKRIQEILKSKPLVCH